MLLAVIGVFGGPSMAVFTMGIFLPFINRKATLIGFLVGAGKLNLAYVPNSSVFGSKESVHLNPH